MMITFGFIESVPLFVSLVPETISKDVAGSQVLKSNFREVIRRGMGGYARRTLSKGGLVGGLNQVKVEC